MIRKMEQEKAERAELYTVGIEELIDNVLVNLTEERPFLSCEDVLYYPKEFGVTERQFSDMFEFFDDFAEGTSRVRYDENDDFPSQSFVFEYGGRLFEGIKTYGQGTDLTLVLLDDVDEDRYDEVIRDIEYVKFYWSIGK